LRLLKDIAATEISLSQTEILNHERLLVQEIERAVTSLTYTEKQLALRKSLIELNNEFASFIESRIETGEASSIEVNQIKIELYSIEQEVQLLENERIELLSSLRQLMGVEVSQSLEVKGELLLPDRLDALPHYTENMLQEHPEYQLKQFLYDMADSQVSLAMAERWGDIAVEVFFENERSVDEPDGIGTDRFFGIGVSIPLPLNNRYRGAIDENRAYRRQVEKEMNALSLSIRSEAEALKMKAEALYAQALHYRENVTQLVDQNLKDMNAAYSSGQISLTELFRSQEQRVKLQSNYLSMVKEFEQTLIDWKAVTATNQLK
jgi:outer membrane protein TolC